MKFHHYILSHRENSCGDIITKKIAQNKWKYAPVWKFAFSFVCDVAFELMLIKNMKFEFSMKFYRCTASMLSVDVKSLQLRARARNNFKNTKLVRKKGKSEESCPS